jgi:hypothetical protein
MQKKSLLSKAQEAAATASKPAASPIEVAALVPLATGDADLAKLMGDRPLVGPVVESAGGTPYIYGWWGTGNQRLIPGIKKGDLVLAADNEHIKLEPPIKGFLLAARQQRCERVPATGQLVRASLEKQATSSKLDEEIEALLLIVAPAGELVPVTWRTRKGACRGLVACMKELLGAGTPEWAQQDEAHKVAARLSQPWARFTVEIDHRLEQPKQQGGNPYPVTSAVCRPIDPDSFSLLKSFLADEDNKKLLKEVYAAHQAKLKEVDEKLSA